MNFQKLSIKFPITETQPFVTTTEKVHPKDCPPSSKSLLTYTETAPQQDVTTPPPQSFVVPTNEDVSLPKDSSSNSGVGRYL